MRFAKRLGTLVLAALPATALTIGVSVPAAHAAQGLPFELTVNPTGSISRTGDVTISGTFKCTTATAALLDGKITQRKVEGLFGFTPTCDRKAHTWSTGLNLTNGKFTPGDATIETTVYYRVDGTGYTQAPPVTQKVRLKKEKKHDCIHQLLS
ncbi:DUF6299 family protein [Dactylosporangium cerinum]|uniref:DUF6299 family protein n=1 Tax=Dactylosporangium cerinum TaxID=1434730 RepID=A0ABV9VIZ1_9ACTN